MKRELWYQSITQYGCPSWQCPVCGKGVIALEKKSLEFKETKASIRARQSEEFVPEELEYVFTAWAKCSHPDCSQDFALSGTGGIEETQVEDNNIDWADYFQPQSCNPMPDMIEIPPKCPKEIEGELRASFELFLINPDACANRIRAAAEKFMDSCGIQKRAKNKSGKYYDLSLHKRIEIFTEKNPDIGKQLMALKWLGNAGSHKTALSKQDLLDGYEIVEHALAEIIGQHSKRMRAIAKQLQKKYGKGKP